MCNNVNVSRYVLPVCLVNKGLMKIVKGATRPRPSNSAGAHSAGHPSLPTSRPTNMSCVLECMQPARNEAGAGWSRVETGDEGREGYAREGVRGESSVSSADAAETQDTEAWIEFQRYSSDDINSNQGFEETSTLHIY